MGFAVMTMTDAAANRVKAIVENSGAGARGLRVGIKKGGCAGMEYTIDLVHEASPKDDLIERDGLATRREVVRLATSKNQDVGTRLISGVPSCRTR